MQTIDGFMKIDENEVGISLEEILKELSSFKKSPFLISTDLVSTGSCSNRLIVGDMVRKNIRGAFEKWPVAKVSQQPYV